MNAVMHDDGVSLAAPWLLCGGGASITPQRYMVICLFVLGSNGTELFLGAFFFFRFAFRCYFLLPPSHNIKRSNDIPMRFGALCLDDTKSPATNSDSHDPIMITEGRALT